MSSSVNIEVVDPIDYEKFIKENISMLEASPLKDLLLFPEDDISVTALQRKFRTVEIPVPGPAKFVVPCICISAIYIFMFHIFRRSDDPLVRDCVRSFTQDWTVVNRK